MVEIANWQEFQEQMATLQEQIATIAETAGQEMRVVFEQGLMILQGEAADYPPQPGETDYRRTGTLGREWVSAGRVIEGRMFGNMIGRVGNATPYGPYVQDPNQQARFHEGVWSTTEDIQRDSRDAIQDLLHQSGIRLVGRMTRRIGGA